MSGQYTQGRLTYQEDSDAYTHILRDGNGRYVASAPQSAKGSSEANARRLAACWNACDGLSIENLEGNITIKEGLRGLNAQLRAARALLADAMDTFDEMPDEDHEIADRIRAFLKGGPV